MDLIFKEGRIIHTVCISHGICLNHVYVKQIDKIHCGVRVIAADNGVLCLEIRSIVLDPFVSVIPPDITFNFYQIVIPVFNSFMFCSFDGNRIIGTELTKLFFRPGGCTAGSRADGAVYDICPFILEGYIHVSFRRVLWFFQQCVVDPNAKAVGAVVSNNEFILICRKVFAV